MSDALEGSPLPADLRALASDSVGATYEVADQLQASGQVTADQAEVLRSAGDAAFLPAFHTAAFLGLGLLLIALLIILIWLPAQAEAVAWKAGGTSALPEGVPHGRAEGEPAVDPYFVEGDLDAEHQVHVVEEDPSHLSHVEVAPLEHPLGEEPPTRS
jgi:hypothetical protein